MALFKFGECFILDCHKEVMPYDIYTYEHVSMGVCCIQDAVDALNKYGNNHLLDNIEKWGFV